MPVTRRRFLSGSAPALAAVPLADLVRPEDLAAAQPAARPGGVFRHGVASGDPRADRVILWTRVSRARTGEVPVRWTLAAEPDVDARGGARRDADGRRARLHGEGRRDRPGAGDDLLLPVRRARRRARRWDARARCPAAGARRVRIALASCANYPHGYFNVYGRHRRRAPTSTSCCTSATTSTSTSRADTLDPRSSGRAPSTRPTRSVALDDYRRRYALYRTDPDLQEAHRQHPVHRRVGRPRDRQQHLEQAARRTTSPSEGDFFARRDARLPGVPRVAADARDRLGAPAAHLSLVRPRRSRPTS